MGAGGAGLALDGGPRFAIGTYLFEAFGPAALAEVTGAGFSAIEAYRVQILPFLDRPRDLLELLERNGARMATCSNGGPGQCQAFTDPAARSRVIEDHVAFVRDFLTVFGCRHFKINMGQRPEGGVTQSHLQALASTLNELGRRTAELGVRLAPHPHIWGPVERPEEIRRVLELTDPEYVGMTLDTAHIRLGGGDPLDLIDRYWDRITAYHWKDVDPSYRHHDGATPSRQTHQQEALYKDLGAGGIDLTAIWSRLQAGGYRYWITLDLDPPRPAQGEGTTRERLARNKRFLLDTLEVTRL